jgi:hypothetical protein
VIFFAHICLLTNDRPRLPASRLGRESAQPGKAFALAGVHRYTLCAIGQVDFLSLIKERRA